MTWEGRNQKWVIAVQEWREGREGREGDELVWLIKETFRGRLQVELCKHVRAFVKMRRSKTRAL